MIYWQQQQPYRNRNDNLMITVASVNNKRQEIIWYNTQQNQE